MKISLKNIISMDPKNGFQLTQKSKKIEKYGFH